MPIQRRLPKVGFTPYRRTVYQLVNLTTLAKAESGATYSPSEMAASGWIKDPRGLVKVLGDGELSLPLNLQAHKFSKSAVEKIEKAGGTVTVISPREASTDSTTPTTDEN
jgi:large subunit ribosomal protein L15